MKGELNINISTKNIKLGDICEVLYPIFKDNDLIAYKIRVNEKSYTIQKSTIKPIYEIGDMIKIVKTVPSITGITGKEELNKIACIYDVVFGDKFPYRLKELTYSRCTEELEIVKTKYELEQEKENSKNIKFAVNNVGDIILKNNDTNEIVFKGKATTPIINHSVKIDTYEKGDILKITDGLFKDIEGKFIDYVKGYDKVLIQIDDMNRLYVDSTNIMLIKKKVNNIHKDEKYNDVVYDLDGFSHPIQVRFHRNHTYVTLSDGTKSRSSCYPSDSFNEEEGIKRSFFRAMVKRYNKALEELNK